LASPSKIARSVTGAPDGAHKSSGAFPVPREQSSRTVAAMTFQAIAENIRMQEMKCVEQKTKRSSVEIANKRMKVANPNSRELLHDEGGS
jgi:hypothetical protein